jgi:MerR family glutamine synthetase transcriptional repressor
MGSLDKDAPVYPIGIVQKLVNLSGRQIRYYEKKGLIAPERTEGNQRLYSPKDVDTLTRIKQLMADGLTLEGVRQKLGMDQNPSPAAPEPTGSLTEESLDAVTQSHMVNQIDSLYPVRNQAALVRLLAARRAIKDTDTAPENNNA